MGLCVGVHRLGGRGALLVDLLGVIGAHADAPGGDGVAVRRLGQMRVDRWWVWRLGRVAARLGHRRVEGHARGGGLIDGVVVGVATIDEQLGGADAGAGLDRFEHRGGLALASAAVGDADADDGASGIRGGGELGVEGRAESHRRASS